MIGVAETEVYHAGGDGVAWRETGSEIVVLDLNGSVYFGLNPTGAALWKLLVDGATRRQLADQLLRRGVDDDQHALRDADDFLQSLDLAGLLHRA